MSHMDLQSVLDYKLLFHLIGSNFFGSGVNFEMGFNTAGQKSYKKKIVKYVKHFRQISKIWKILH